MASMGNDLNGQPAELHFTVTVKRKATGLTETYQMVGTPLPPQEPEIKDESDERHA